MIPAKTSRAAILLLAALALTACSFFDSKPKPQADYSAVKGQATIKEIHADLNYVILQTENGPRKAWWDEASKFYAGQTQVQQLSLLPGQRVQYLGILAFNEIYLSRLIQLR